MTAYTDFDYDTLPPVDLDLDLHWIQLPVAVWEAKQTARREALQAAHPEHKIILVPLTRAPSSTAPSSPASNPTPKSASPSATPSAPRFTAHGGWRNPHPA
ncbi:MAG: hypothetical protein K2X03_16780 [Bryobacteraceae bacterium]|nr:hypothetical protein [Bryobacteraceae bacterium]